MKIGFASAVSATWRNKSSFLYRRILSTKFILSSVIGAPSIGYVFRKHNLTGIRRRPPERPSRFTPSLWTLSQAAKTHRQQQACLAQNMSHVTDERVSQVQTVQAAMQQQLAAMRDVR